MKLPTLFKVREYNRYNYQPRYYDARKERIEKLKKIYGANSTKVTENRIREQWRLKQRSRINKTINFRLLIVLAFLVAILYIIAIKLNIELF